MKPPTILPRAAEFFFANIGIFPHGYFTEKKENEKPKPKTTKGNKDFNVLNSQQNV